MVSRSVQGLLQQSGEALGQKMVRGSTGEKQKVVEKEKARASGETLFRGGADDRRMLGETTPDTAAGGASRMRARTAKNQSEVAVRGESSSGEGGGVDERRRTNGGSGEDRDAQGISVEEEKVDPGRGVELVRMEGQDARPTTSPRQTRALHPPLKLKLSEREALFAELAIQVMQDKHLLEMEDEELIIGTNHRLPVEVPVFSVDEGKNLFAAMAVARMIKIYGPIVIRSQEDGMPFCPGVEEVTIPAVPQDKRPSRGPHPTERMVQAVADEEERKERSSQASVVKAAARTQGGGERQLKGRDAGRERGWEQEEGLKVPLWSLKGEEGWLEGKTRRILNSVKEAFKRGQFEENKIVVGREWEARKEQLEDLMVRKVMVMMVFLDKVDSQRRKAVYSLRSWDLRESDDDAAVARKAREVGRPGFLVGKVEDLRWEDSKSGKRRLYFRINCSNFSKKLLERARWNRNWHLKRSSRSTMCFFEDEMDMFEVKEKMLDSVVGGIEEELEAEDLDQVEEEEEGQRKGCQGEARMEREAVEGVEKESGGGVEEGRKRREEIRAGEVAAATEAALLRLRLAEGQTAALVAKLIVESGKKEKGKVELEKLISGTVLKMLKDQEQVASAGEENTVSREIARANVEEKRPFGDEVGGGGQVNGQQVEVHQQVAGGNGSEEHGAASLTSGVGKGVMGVASTGKGDLAGGHQPSTREEGAGKGATFVAAPGQKEGQPGGTEQQLAIVREWISALPTEEKLRWSRELKQMAEKEAEQAARGARESRLVEVVTTSGRKVVTKAGGRASKSAEMAQRICFELKDRGSCRWGVNCKFRHYEEGGGNGAKVGGRLEKGTMARQNRSRDGEKGNRPHPLQSVAVKEAQRSEVRIRGGRGSPATLRAGTCEVLAGAVLASIAGFNTRERAIRDQQWRHH